MPDPLHAVFERARRLVGRLVAPLRRGEGPNKFQLSSPDIATTSADSAVGWRNRPPATFECPRCSNEIRQRRGHDRIDCPRCVAEFDYSEFPELPFRHFVCPNCRSRMRHGYRHPEQFEIPEWATCADCKYHWEFEHFYERRPATQAPSLPSK